MSAKRIFIKGNEAIGHGALDAGCRCYFGYPITPQNEIPEAMSKLMPERGGEFVQPKAKWPPRTCSWARPRPACGP